MKRRRFYYLTDSLGETVEMAQAFENQGIPHDQIHVLGKNEDGLVRHDVNEGTPLQVYDVAHLGGEGAIIGALIGLFAGIGLYWWNPFSFEITFWMVFLVIIVFTAHGAWSGGLVGTHARNYRIKPFLKDLEAGKFLTLVDINQDQTKKLKNAEKLQHVSSEGNSPTGSNPFEKWLSFRVTQSEWPKVRR